MNEWINEEFKYSLCVAKAFYEISGFLMGQYLILGKPNGT